MTDAELVLEYLRRFSDSISILPEAEIFELAHVRGVFSNRAMFNRFYDAVVPSRVSADDVAAVAEICRRKSKKAVWMIDSSRLDARLQRELATHSFHRSSEWRGMAMKVEPRRLSTTDLDIIRVEDGETLGEWARIVTEVENVSAAQAEAFVELYRTLGWTNSGWRHIIARSNGVDVAAASLFYFSEHIAIDWVATREGFRRRGSAEYLVTLLLNDAASNGGEKAVLTSTAAGHSLYARMGFRDVSTIVTFVCEP